LLLLISSLALAYEPVNGISFPNVTKVEEYDFYHNIRFRFQLYRQKNTQYFDNLIYRGIFSSSLAAWKRIEKIGAINKQCGSDILEIFEISEAQLNNPKRFPEGFIGHPEQGVPNLWGFFDPRTSEPGYDSIVVSYQGADKINFKLIVHEIAHYWYSSFCLENYTIATSEQFATVVEKEVVWPE
jgi:hypothetical protein